MPVFKLVVALFWYYERSLLTLNVPDQMQPLLKPRSIRTRATFLYHRFPIFGQNHAMSLFSLEFLKNQRESRKINKTSFERVQSGVLCFLNPLKVRSLQLNLQTKSRAPTTTAEMTTTLLQSTKVQSQESQRWVSVRLLIYWRPTAATPGKPSRDLLGVRCMLRRTPP